MRIKEVKVYSFSELDTQAQEKAINKMYDINVNFDWWQFIYEDAREIGLKLDSFDLDRNRHATGNFIDSSFECAQEIISNHGKTCETYKAAKEYLSDYEILFNKYGIISEDNEYQFENEAEELSDNFLNEILECYSIMLQDESEYLMSRRAIVETIEINKYEFDEEGNIV